MPIVVSDAGEIRLLEMMFRTASPPNFSLRLYTNAHTPTATSVIGSFTEATFTGYTARTLTRGTFTVAVTVAGKGEISYPDQTWTATSAQTVTGYYVLDASGNYLYADLFPASRALVSGDVLVLSPRFTLASE